MASFTLHKFFEESMFTDRIHLVYMRGKALQASQIIDFLGANERQNRFLNGLQMNFVSNIKTSWSLASKKMWWKLLLHIDGIQFPEFEQENSRKTKNWERLENHIKKTKMQCLISWKTYLETQKTFPNRSHSIWERLEEFKENQIFLPDTLFFYFWK